MSLAAEKRRKAKALEEAGAALSVKLSARSTRGQRISELQGEDAEADETFWGQGAWQEAEEGDSEFSSEEEEPDKFDNDFNDSESEDEDDDGAEETALRKNERAAKRKRPAGGVYKEPKRFVPAKRKPAPTPGSSSRAAAGGPGSAGGEGEAEDRSGEVGVPIKRSVRASTKNKTEKSFKVREGEAKAREAQLKRSTPQPKTLKGQFTQKQLLLEAIHTEQDNMRWILKQQRLEDEAKEDEARPKQHKALVSRYLSRRGCVDTICFPDAFYLPAVLRQLPAATADSTAGDGAAGEERSPKRICKVTGAPARYKDPLTGYDYADVAAFRELRKQYGASARQRVKAQQQEQEAKEVGAALGGSGAAGTRVDNGAVAAGAGTGAGATGAAVATAVVAGNGALKGTGASSQAGGQSSAQGKKQGSSKEAEKKAKSSAGKGKGKSKGAAKGGSPARTEGSAPSPTRSGDDGVARERPEKTKAGTKRPRKQGSGGKSAKPAKRPFFAPAPAAANAVPPVAGHEAELVPLKGNSDAYRGDGSAAQQAAPLSAGVAVAAAPATAGGQMAQVTSTAAPYPSPAAASSADGATPSTTSLDAPSRAVDVQARNTTLATATATKAPLATRGVTGQSVVAPVLAVPTVAAAPPVAEATSPRQQATTGGTGGLANGWDSAGSASAAHKYVGWQQPVQTAALSGRPPG